MSSELPEKVDKILKKIKNLDSRLDSLRRGETVFIIPIVEEGEILDRDKVSQISDEEKLKRYIDFLDKTQKFALKMMKEKNLKSYVIDKKIARKIFDENFVRMLEEKSNQILSFPSALMIRTVDGQKRDFITITPSGERKDLNFPIMVLDFKEDEEGRTKLYSNISGRSEKIAEISEDDVQLTDMFKTFLTVNLVEPEEIEIVVPDKEEDVSEIRKQILEIFEDLKERREGITRRELYENLLNMKLKREGQETTPDTLILYSGSSEDKEFQKLLETVHTLQKRGREVVLLRVDRGFLEKIYPEARNIRELKNKPTALVFERTLDNALKVRAFSPFKDISTLIDDIERELTEEDVSSQKRTLKKFKDFVSYVRPDTRKIVWDKERGEYVLKDISIKEEPIEIFWDKIIKGTSEIIKKVSMLPFLKEEKVGTLGKIKQLQTIDKYLKTLDATGKRLELTKNILQQKLSQNDLSETEKTNIRIALKDIAEKERQIANLRNTLSLRKETILYSPEIQRLQTISRRTYPTQTRAITRYAMSRLGRYIFWYGLATMAGMGEAEGFPMRNLVMFLLFSLPLIAPMPYNLFTQAILVVIGIFTHGDLLTSFIIFPYTLCFLYIMACLQFLIVLYRIMGMGIREENPIIKGVWLGYGWGPIAITAIHGLYILVMGVNPHFYLLPLCLLTTLYIPSVGPIPIPVPIVPMFIALLGITLFLSVVVAIASAIGGGIILTSGLSRYFAVKARSSNSPLFYALMRLLVNLFIPFILYIQSAIILQVYIQLALQIPLKSF
ncbi:MAG: hypothetical protein B6U95_00320 [Thermofilum sp. ex4484_82]|nr:MAG: hypothetical protein B6U95_00320 [Thermofilum sp. ex4484_82]OYT40059.1 MAG: hypothetical protein B6U96_00320 [Archaeoglobales archaeon ex4484_92]